MWEVRIFPRAPFRGVERIRAATPSLKERRAVSMRSRTHLEGLVRRLLLRIVVSSDPGDSHPHSGLGSTGVRFPIRDDAPRGGCGGVLSGHEPIIATLFRELRAQ